MTITGFIGYAQGWGGLYIRANRLAYKLRRRHPAAGIADRFGIPDVPERVHWDDDLARTVGTPRSYDYGPERASWLTHQLTDWIGDDGFLVQHSSQIRRHNPTGDVITITGKVTEVDAGHGSGHGGAVRGPAGRRAVGPGHRDRAVPQAEPVVVSGLRHRLPDWGTEVVVEGEGAAAFRRYRRRPESLAHLLGDLGRWADRVALVAGDRRITYAEHLEDIDTVAQELTRRGIGPGDRVMVLAANSPEWVTAFWAVARVGGVVVLGNAWWSASDITHAVASVGPALVVADERRLALLAPDVQVLSVDRVGALMAQPPSGPAVEERVPADDADAMVIFTSGTEGKAKGVRLSHRAVVSNVQNLLVRTRRLPSELPAGHEGTVSLLCLPLFHVGGIQTLIAGQLSGGRMLFLEGRFDPEEVLGLIQRERVRFFGGVPTMISRVLDCPALGVLRHLQHRLDRDGGIDGGARTRGADQTRLSRRRGRASPTSTGRPRAEVR